MSSTQRAEALFDFEPTAEVELKMRKGDVVTVKRMSVGEGWWEGEHNGKRGLFPSSFVKLLPSVPEPVEVAPPCSSPPTPLTPRSTKKAFMETLLAPQTSTLDAIYDEDKARELFVPSHNVVSIELGPKWKCRPPTLTVVVKEPQTELRFSGMKHVTLFDVETKELNSRVPRKYKQFLWLYDRLAENFPCISLPPLPVKQASGGHESKDTRRKGLEKFLRQVARHPVLGCTRFLKVFLTEDAKSDKEWKIGKHLSHLGHNVKLPKTSRKLFSAPVYSTVKYPPYNVPVSQLASIEKFSRFSRLLESNVNTLHIACRGVTMSQRDMVSNVNLLAKDLKCFARGVESIGGAHRRKLQAKSVVGGVSSTPLPSASVPPSLHTTGSSTADPLSTGVEGQEEGSSGGEEGGVESGGQPNWNWRDDEKFNEMLTQLVDLSGRLQRMSRLFHVHREAMETEVMETLQEYSAVINTLPGLVRLHEEAMEFYNSSKTKDSKMEAEEVRQNCETLNNILLAEFDYFSNHLVNDFPVIINRLLLQQASFHRKMAEEWDSLRDRYSENVTSPGTPPVHVFSTSPTLPASHATSASQPHLPTLHPPSSRHTPNFASDLLTSSGSSHSQDDVGYSRSTNTAANIPSQSQSHPNILNLTGFGTKTSATASNDAEEGSGLTSSSNSHTEIATPPTATPPTDVVSEFQSSSPRSYVNFNIDELNGERERRLNRLSPLELSIEKELERAHGGGTPNSEGKPTEDAVEPHTYANWQFEKMNEKSTAVQKPSRTATKPLLLNGVPTGRLGNKPDKPAPPPVVTSSPRKPLKPPSPFRLQNLSDLTSLNPSSSSSSSSSSTSTSTHSKKAGESTTTTTSTTTPLHSLPKVTTPLHSLPKVFSLDSVDDSRGGGDGGGGSGSGGREPLTKAFSSPRIHEPDGAEQAMRNMDPPNRILPSQLNLGTKPRSYSTTTSQYLAKKKPILPPAPGSGSGSGGGGVKRRSFKPWAKKQETVSVTTESLDIVEELERSFERDATTPGQSGSSSSSSSNQATFWSLGREAGRGGATKVEKPSSPSSELLRKLSQRRQRLEQQLTASGAGKHTSGSTTASSTDGGDSSLRTSTSSTQSELVCSYNLKRSHDDLSTSGLAADVELRSKDEAEASLAKYGIVEEGNSFEI